MRSKFRHSIANYYPNVAGGIFLALGMTTLLYPQIMGYYSIVFDEADASVATRAMIGGGEVGIAFVLLTGNRINLSVGQRSLIAATIFLCVGLSRLFGVWIEGPELSITQPIREATIEIALGVVGLWVGQRSNSNAQNKVGKDY